MLEMSFILVKLCDCDMFVYSYLPRRQKLPWMKPKKTKVQQKLFLLFFNYLL